MEYDWSAAPDAVPASHQGRDEWEGSAYPSRNQKEDVSVPPGSQAQEFMVPRIMVFER